MSNILVVAAHPDDELLGIGGTILQHTIKKDTVSIVIMCEGESLRYGKDVGQSKAIANASKVLGVEKVQQLGFPDQKLDQYSLIDLISPLEKISNEFRPNIIYCQSGSDANQDHRRLFEAANIAFRPTNEWIHDFFTFYTVSSTEWGYPRNFIPDTWIDISDVMEQKISAFKCYETEIRPYPHPRSEEAIRNQNAFWGNQVCLEYAEVLMTIRRIKKKNDSRKNH